MRDKQVRRRRAVLALLVVASLILLTAYFGESASSPLHSVQRGIVEVLSPIQAGASKVLTPVRDVAGWFSDTIRAKSKAEQLKKENNQLQAKLVLAQQQSLLYQQLAREQHLDTKLGLQSSQLLNANVISQDPSLWYSTIEVDKGSSDGVTTGEAVVGDSALVGKVTSVESNASTVTLITDHTFGVAAEVQNASGDRGQLIPQVGNPYSLVLEFVDPQANIQPGQQVVTAGFKTTSGGLGDLYPAGIPIGSVPYNFNVNQLRNNGQVTVRPGADLRHLEVVQILTHVQGGTQLADVTKPATSNATSTGGTTTSGVGAG